MNTYQWLCVLGIPSLIATVLGYVGVQYKQIKAIKLGLQALLRDRLLQAFNFYLARGWISASERDNVDNMYVQYEALGQNNVISDIYHQVRELPSIPPASHPVEAHAIAQ